MSTLGAQTVCTPRIGGSKYRWPWNMYLLGRLHNLGPCPTISFQVAIKHTNKTANKTLNSENAPRPCLQETCSVSNPDEWWTKMQAKFPFVHEV
jgi:hypothetical protein